jgi:hypothetical protein
MSTAQEPIEVGDKKTAKPTSPDKPSFQFQPSAGDYRDAHAKTVQALEESSSFLFHDLHLPDNKDLLGLVNKAIKDMPKGDDTARLALTSDDELMIQAANGKLKAASLTRPDHSVDMAQFDDKGNVTQELNASQLGVRKRTYRPDHTLAREDNATDSYNGYIEFDGKGQIVHSHDETENDSKDSLKKPDGSGVETVVHNSDNPAEAFTATLAINTDRSMVHDKKYKDGNYEHFELNKYGQVTKAVQSNLAKGYIEHQEVQPDGTTKEYKELIT